MTRQSLIEIGLALALTLAAVLFVALAAWAAPGNGITVSGAWARPTIGDGRITAAYMTIENLGSEGDVLRGASSPRAAQVQIHETEMTDQGIMKMRPVGDDGLPIPPGKSASLKPAGTHIMIMGLDTKLVEGDMLPLTLTFETAGPVEILVPVGNGPSDEAGKEGAAGMDHSHH